MARIYVPSTTPVGKVWNSALNKVREATNEVNQAIRMAQAAIDGGEASLLELPGTCEAQDGCGAAFMADMQEMKAQLDPLNVTIAKYDQGQ